MLQKLLPMIPHGATPQTIDRYGTVKMVAYRAETARATIVREELSHEDEARSLIPDLFRTDADIHPDEAARVLQVRLHTLAHPRSNRAVQHLLDHLNAAAFTYPGTNLRLTYTLLDPVKRLRGTSPLPSRSGVLNGGFGHVRSRLTALGRWLIVGREIRERIVVQKKKDRKVRGGMQFPRFPAENKKPLNHPLRFANSS